MYKNKNLNSDSSFELELKKSLSSFGFLFPTTDSEVEAFEKEFNINSVELPKSLQDLMEILKKGRIKSIEKKEAKIIDMNTATNMKRAARKGENIPDEISNKMKQDRENAENDKEE